MNWHIGQRIVAVRNHSGGAFNKGDEFFIKGLTDGYCDHGLLIDIGKVTLPHVNWCPICKKEGSISHGVRYFHEVCFAPLDDLSDHTIESLIEYIDITNPVEIPELT